MSATQIRVGLRLLKKGSLICGPSPPKQGFPTPKKTETGPCRTCERDEDFCRPGRWEEAWAATEAGQRGRPTSDNGLTLRCEPLLSQFGGSPINTWPIWHREQHMGTGKIVTPPNVRRFVRLFFRKLTAPVGVRPVLAALNPSISAH
jgi:hypothetical protein